MDQGNGVMVYEIPFLDRMGFVFVLCAIGMYLISWYDFKRGVKTNGLEVDSSMFVPNRSFTIGAIVIIATLTVLYTMFW